MRTRTGVPGATVVVAAGVESPEAPVVVCCGAMDVSAAVVESFTGIVVVFGAGVVVGGGGAGVGGAGVSRELHSPAGPKLEKHEAHVGGRAARKELVAPRKDDGPRLATGTGAAARTHVLDVCNRTVVRRSERLADFGVERAVPEE